MLTPSEIAKEVESGTRSALSAAVLLKRMSEDLEAAYTAVRKRAYEEYLTYGGEEITVDGAKVTKYSGRTTYDYKSIPHWRKLDKAKRDYEEQVKYATRMMMERNETVVDEETGEIIPVAESRTGEDSISIKL